MAPPRRTAPRPRSAPERTPARPREVGPPLLSRLSTEDPHAHIVCRVCGRIQGVELSELDRHLLTELAALRPDGWNVERIAFSLSGACRRCREGPDVP